MATTEEIEDSPLNLKNQDLSHLSSEEAREFFLRLEPNKSASSILKELKREGISESSYAVFMKNVVQPLENETDLVTSEGQRSGKKYFYGENAFPVLKTLETTGKISNEDSNSQSSSTSSQDEMVTENLDEADINVLLEDPDHDTSYNVLSIDENFYESETQFTAGSKVSAEDPAKAIEYVLSESGNEILYGELANKLGLERDKLLDYIISARDEGLEIQREFRENKQWVYMKKDLQDSSSSKANIADEESKTEYDGDIGERPASQERRAMYRPDNPEEARRRFREDNTPDLGEKIEPTTIKGATQVKSQNLSEKYRTIWAPKVHPVLSRLGEGESIAYDQIHDEVENMAFPRVKQTMAWIAEEWGNIETYRNGVVVKEEL